MAFPDRIERTVELAHPPARVWTALTTAEGLASWFGHEAEIDLRPGGAGVLRWPDHVSPIRVERVEEPRAFGFTWPVHGLPEGDPRRTYVEFTLEATDGGTRLTVVETGFAQLSAAAHDTAFGGNVKGWAAELGDLVASLAA
ncbi:SRPBCC domain-containing protein [Pseudonocardia xishanensis]|uniref:Activator of Hsp90 ATPase homologue 1/2-like C-terminal domain-containing protein n=1 Tax=Pseudonocardia xishanensis TaxID=630995 RepID=A0ABP8S3V6_9PSEU